MQRRQAFKYELRPNGAQIRQLRQFAGSYRQGEPSDTGSV